jgi:hypothetical protein
MDDISIYQNDEDFQKNVSDYFQKYVDTGNARIAFIKLKVYFFKKLIILYI